MLQKFYNFLKSEGVYDQFMQYTKERTGETFDSYRCNIMLHPKNYIDACFYWPNTKEGQHFWSKINQKWQQFLLSR